MKLKSKLLSLFLMLSAIASAESGVVVTISNFQSSTVGIPIVTATGVPVDQGQAFASAGIFDVGVNFSTMTLAQILAAFTPVDATPVALNANFDGLFSAQDLSNQPYASGAFAGSAAYIVIGNSSNFSLATMFAIYSPGAVFPTPDAIGNAAITLSATGTGGWVFGNLRPVTVQPTLPSAAYTTGIQMTTDIPEPTVALLGCLGLLGLIRRRR